MGCAVITTDTSQPTPRERLAGYYARLAQQAPNNMHIGWRAEAGMRFLRALAGRPSALPAAAAGRVVLSPRRTP